MPSRLHRVQRLSWFLNRLHLIAFGQTNNFYLMPATCCRLKAKPAIRRFLFILKPPLKGETRRSFAHADDHRSPLKRVHRQQVRCYGSFFSEINSDSSVCCKDAKIANLCHGVGISLSRPLKLYDEKACFVIETKILSFNRQKLPAGVEKRWRVSKWKASYERTYWRIPGFHRTTRQCWCFDI